MIPPKKPLAGPPRPPVPSAPPHISNHCRAIKGSSAQAKLQPKFQRPIAPPVVQRPKPRVVTPPSPSSPRLVQPKMAPVQMKHRATVTPGVPARPAAPFTRPLTVGPGRAVIQRMEVKSAAASDSVAIPIASVSGALLSVRRARDGAIIHVTASSDTDQLDGVCITSAKTYAGNYITFTNYSKGNELPDGGRAAQAFCHQTYIKVNDGILRQGVSYVLAYAGARYAVSVLGHTHVGTNMANSSSAALSEKLGFGKAKGIEVRPAAAVIQQAAAGMLKYGWQVYGGSLASGSSGSSSASASATVTTPLLPDSAPKKSRCCCFLTTACCDWRGLPDDCEELTLLRHYRDTYLRDSEAGVSAIRHYYNIAPSIVAAIDRDRDAKSIYDWIYEVIQQCLVAIRRQDYDSVFEQYKQMVLDLEQRYVQPADGNTD